MNVKDFYKFLKAFRVKVFFLFVFLFLSCAGFIEENKNKNENFFSNKGIYLTASDPAGNKIGKSFSSLRSASPLISSGWNFSGALVNKGASVSDSDLKSLKFDIESGTFYYAMTQQELSSKGNKDFYIFAFSSSISDYTPDNASLYIKKTLTFDGQSLSYEASGTFAINESSSQKGNVSLLLNVSGTSINHLKYEIKKDESTEVYSDSSSLQSNNILIKPLTSDSAPYAFDAGSYTLVMKFYNKNGDEENLIYARTENIVVWPVCTTDKWFTFSGLSENALTVTNDLIFKTFFVCGQNPDFYSTNIKNYSSPSDENTGGITSPLESLNEALKRILLVNNASSDFQIYIDGKITESDTEISSDKNLNLKIKGLSSSSAIDCNSMGRGFLINAVTSDKGIIFENFSIKNASSSSNGAGICLTKGKLTIKNCNISYCSTSLKGGAVYIDSNGELIVDSSTLENNEASNEGGAVYNKGSFTLKSGSLSKNKANSGSAFYMENQSEAEIFGGSILQNISTASVTSSTLGSAVYLDGGTLSLKGGEISGNTGGPSLRNGIWYAGGSLKISGSFYASKDDKLYIANSKTITLESLLTPPSESNGITATITPSAYTKNLSCFILNSYSSEFFIRFNVTQNSSTPDTYWKITAAGKLDSFENFKTTDDIISEGLTAGESYYVKTGSDCDADDLKELLKKFNNVTGGAPLLGEDTIIDLSEATELKNLNDSGFWFYNNIKTVILPPNLTGVSNQMFENIRSTANIVISESNPYFSTQDGILYNKNKTKLIYYPLAKEGSSFTLPESVVELAYGAFYRNINLESIENISQITTLKSMKTFYGMEKIKELDLSGLKNLLGENSTTLPSYTFDGNSGLTKVTLSSNITSIGGNSFRNCTALKEVHFKSTNPPELVRFNKLPEFYNCNSELKFYVPSGMKNAYVGNSYYTSSDTNYFAGSISNRVIEE